MRTKDPQGPSRPGCWTVEGSRLVRKLEVLGKPFGCGCIPGWPSSRSMPWPSPISWPATEIGVRDFAAPEADHLGMLPAPETCCSHQSPQFRGHSLVFWMSTSRVYQVRVVFEELLDVFQNPKVGSGRAGSSTTAMVRFRHRPLPSGRCVHGPVYGAATRRVRVSLQGVGPHLSSCHNFQRALAKDGSTTTRMWWWSRPDFLTGPGFPVTRRRLAPVRRGHRAHSSCGAGPRRRQW